MGSAGASAPADIWLSAMALKAWASSGIQQSIAAETRLRLQNPIPFPGSTTLPMEVRTNPHHDAFRAAFWHPITALNPSHGSSGVILDISYQGMCLMNSALPRASCRSRNRIPPQAHNSHTFGFPGDSENPTMGVPLFDPIWGQDFNFPVFV